MYAKLELPVSNGDRNGPNIAAENQVVGDRSGVGSGLGGEQVEQQAPGAPGVLSRE